MAKEKPLVLVRDSNGCITPSSHALNQDGYFRKWIPSEKRMIMYHVWKWKEAGNTIQDGYEINHKCCNRACCNVEHLECIHGKDHAILTNRSRYAPRKAAAYEYWKEYGCTGVYLGKVFGVTFSSACSWIREWKA